MTGIGQKLRSCREGMGISLDKVRHDLRINRRFLEALESENWQEFPAEVYLIGFLSRYTQYLGLSSREIIGIYQKEKVQEQKNIAKHQADLNASSNATHQNSSVRIGLAAFAFFVLLISASFWSPFYSQEKNHERKTGDLKVIRLGDHVLKVKARHKAWLQLTVGQRRIFEGWIPAQSIRRWASPLTYYIYAPQKNSLEISIDGKIIHPSLMFEMEKKSKALLFEINEPS